MTVDHDLETRRQEAASWFARLNQKRVSTADVEAFGVWRRDPDNAKAYAKVEAIWEASETLSKDADLAVVTHQARARSRSGGQRVSRTGPRVRPVVAIGALAVIAAAGLMWSRSLPQHYETAVGERREVRLADGSVLTLDTDTEVLVRLRARERLVTVEQGQAFFAVQGDAARPFVVRAGQTAVTAIGTRFDVRREGEGARVILVEGRVTVARSNADPSPIRLTPGQSVSTSHRQPKVVAVDAARVTSWTTGRLIFQDTPISAAVAEVNRYSKTKIDLNDRAIASIGVSGAFDAGDTEGFVAALQDLYGVETRPGPNGSIVVASRTAGK